ncbi:MAG: DinB family protein [Bryobacteraceae bacterium]
MLLTSVILEQLDREAEITRRALERVPEGKNDWKPHPKSMPLGQLAHMVATMPSWISLIVKQDEMDITPKAGSGNGAARTLSSNEELVKAHDKAVAEARQAVAGTNDEFLQSKWKLLEGGKVAMENPRYLFILDNFNHLAHHRGQLTVYLRLNDAQVPAIYGPSADDHRF